MKLSEFKEKINEVEKATLSRKKVDGAYLYFCPYLCNNLTGIFSTHSKVVGDFCELYSNQIGNTGAFMGYKLNDGDINEEYPGSNTEGQEHRQFALRMFEQQCIAYKMYLDY